MEWIDVKYVNLLSGRLVNFKRKSSTLYNFSCAFCDDNARKKNSARGYIYEKQGKSLYHCHKCKKSLSFGNFLKLLDQSLYNEYIFEKLRLNKTTEQKDLDEFVAKMKKPKFMSSEVLSKLKKISQLSPNDPLKKYIIRRKIPNKMHGKLFSCPNFMHFVNELIPNKFSEKSLKYDETRLLIPFINAAEDVPCFQGRSMIPDAQVRYITIVLDETQPTIFGLDRVNFNIPTYCFEGPIDAMFIDNSIAIAGGGAGSINVALKNIDKSNLIVVFDNEPRNKDTLKKINSAILQGFSVCIWPDNIEQKDVNEMILAGLSVDYIEHTIRENTFKDLQAKMALLSWSKVNI